MRPWLPITAALVLATSPGMAEDKPVLTIYTYESFTSEWGPGPVIAKKFEETCDCVVKFVGAGDGAGLLSRLRLEGERSPADIVLGLDTNLTAEATATGLFGPHGIEDPALDLPVAWSDPIFLPYDWGYFAFVYDETRLANPPWAARLGLMACSRSCSTCSAIVPSRSRSMPASGSGRLGLRMTRPP